MSPVGTQRAIAIIIFLSPWIYVPMPLKELVFIMAGVLLFISTLDIKRSAKQKETPPQHHVHHEVQTQETSQHSSVHPTVPSI